MNNPREIKREIERVKQGFADAAERLGLLESEVQGGLGDLRDEAADALIAALTHSSEKMRFEAAWALAGFRAQAPRAIPKLVKLLKDPSGEVRAQAAETLSQVGLEVQFVPEAVAALGAEDPIIREHIAIALCDLGAAARDAAPALQAALADSVKHVRRNAARALGQIGADATPALPRLYELVSLEDSETQIDIVEALVAICKNNPTAVQRLRELIAAPGVPLRGSAAVALRRAAQLA